MLLRKAEEGLHETNCGRPDKVNVCGYILVALLDYVYTIQGIWSLWFLLSNFYMAALSAHISLSTSANLPVLSWSCLAV